MQRVVACHTAIPYLILGLILFIQGIAIYLLNDGKLTYILDDPYIHLSLARNIAHGHYGINLVEPSAPSSSIIWPFLLAPFARLPFYEYIPLLLNIGFGVCTLFFIHKIIDLIFHNSISSAKKIFISVIFIVTTAVSTLIWSGMEHVLQIFLSVFIIYNLIDLEINNKLNKSLIIVIIFHSLVRYENLSICIPSLMFIFFKGYKKLSLLSLSTIISALAAFSYFLHSLGLNYLPTSVIIKGSYFSNKTSLEIFLINLTNSMQAPTWLFLFSILILIALKLRQKSHMLFIVTISASIILQLLFGTTFKSFYRYESYMIVYALIAFIYLYNKFISETINNTRKYLIVIILASGFLIGYLDYIHCVVYTPMFANSIYAQSYQIARFTDNYYNKNVGVNDIGLVSYMNHNYTLDLFGLSNIDVVDYRKSRTPGWMNQMADRYNVDLIMIYDEWFKGYIPSEWIKIGELNIDIPTISVAYKEMAFYVRNPANVAEVRQLIKQFAQTLPANTTFDFAQE
ncbi:hypothetical protein [Herpetosiphon llansteffanensis]|uniref:hypothetical protein n=1 Tax=Herpetosiphon llansteffanensis TaxID=2094568 RepID=UPI000D7CFE0B|nr:hypothetical protein [Herpetosiphon llansteffanensis]